MALVFHSGTALRDGQVVTNGGRLLCVTATAATLSAARRRAYAAADAIHIPGARRREDVALAAVGGVWGALLPGHPNLPPTVNSIARLANNG